MRAIACADGAGRAAQRRELDFPAAGTGRIICDRDGLFGAQHRAEPAEIAAAADRQGGEKITALSLLFFKPDDRIEGI